MKKTRFEKFMVSLTKKALAEETLETFEDHLTYAWLSIEFELLKKGGKKKTTKKAAAGKMDRIASGLGTTKRTLIRIGGGLKKMYAFLSTGNNFVLVFIGGLFLYAVLVMTLEMI